jgi:Carboxypeptidase regulatory-like domain
VADYKVKMLDALVRVDAGQGGRAENGHPEIAEGVDCRTCHQTTTVARNAFDGAPAMTAGLHPHASFAEAAQGEKHDLAALRVKTRLSAARELAISLDGASFEQVLSRKMLGEVVLDGSTKNAPQTTIEGTVYGEDGKPAPGVTVICGSAIDRATARTTTDKQGNFKIKETGVTGWAELRAGGGNGGLRRSRMFLQDGQGNRWDPVLERNATIRGRAVDDTGAPLEGWVIELEGLNTGWNDECTVQKGGAFELPNLPGGSFRLLAWRKDGGRRLPAAVVPGVLADSGEVLVTVPKQRGSLKVTPYLPAGLVDVPVEVRAFQEASGRGASLARGKKNDEFTADGLPSGWYRVQIGGEQLGWLDLGPQWCDGAGECDLGKVSLPPGGTLRVQHDALADGKERSEELCRRMGACDVRMPFASGTEGVPVPAGRYVYLWREGDGELRHRSVEVQSGRETVLDLRAEGR